MDAWILLSEHATLNVMLRYSAELIKILLTIGWRPFQLILLEILDLWFYQIHLLNKFFIWKICFLCHKFTQLLRQIFCRLRKSSQRNIQEMETDQSCMRIVHCPEMQTTKIQVASSNLLIQNTWISSSYQALVKDNIGNNKICFALVFSLEIYFCNICFAIFLKNFV